MLYVVKSNGETFAIDDDDFPLYIRLRLGPCHDESQVCFKSSSVIKYINTVSLLSLSAFVHEVAG